MLPGMCIYKDNKYHTLRSGPDLQYAVCFLYKYFLSYDVLEKNLLFSTYYSGYGLI
jgi:hypothetical protein